MLLSFILLGAILVWCLGVPSFLIGTKGGRFYTLLAVLYLPVAVALLIILVGVAVAPA
jgi:hypothetical protein